MKKFLMFFMIIAFTVSFMACRDKMGAADNKNADSDGQAASITSFKDAKVGDIVYFGNYEQDNDTSNGYEEIAWLVLDKKEDKMLVVSKYILEMCSYNEDRRDVTWETCSLRTWLNSEFYETAFSSKEQQKIVEVKNENESSEWYFNTSYYKSRGAGNYSFGGEPIKHDYPDAGNSTYDKVFLLSIEEVYQCYMLSESERMCESTEYVKNKFMSGVSGPGEWALRSPGIGADRNLKVHGDGFIDGFYILSNNYSGVRPAMWITVE